VARRRAAHRCLRPDIYTRDPAAVEKFLERYAEPGPLVVPEIGNAASSRASSGRRSATAR
jgi:hypothetical protein